MLETPNPVARRGLLTGGLGVLAVVVGGCEAAEDLLGAGDDPRDGGSVTPTAPPADADGVLVSEVAAALAAAGALALATSTTTPTLARTGARLARLHEGHARDLGWSGTAPPPRVPSAPAAAARRLWQAEQRLQQRLVSAAMAAESGALAQTLASMAAAVAQQRAVLDR